MFGEGMGVGLTRLRLSHYPRQHVIRRRAAIIPRNKLWLAVAIPDHHGRRAVDTDLLAECNVFLYLIRILRTFDKFAVIEAKSLCGGLPYSVVILPRRRH